MKLSAGGKKKQSYTNRHMRREPLPNTASMKEKNLRMTNPLLVLLKSGG